MTVLVGLLRFGAYSAMMVAIRAPGLFKCAVGYAGLYPYERAAKLVQPLVGESHAWITKTAASAVCVVSLGASLVVLHRYLKHSSVDEDDMLPAAVSG